MQQVWKITLGISALFVLIALGLWGLARYGGTTSTVYHSEDLGISFVINPQFMTIREHEEGLLINDTRYPAYPYSLARQPAPAGANLSDLLELGGVPKDIQVGRTIHGVDWISYFHTPQDPQEFMVSAQYGEYFYHFVLPQPEGPDAARAARESVFQLVETTSFD